jgi:Arc/MetJ-type ribon-helix-helix transcriptional regulator
MTVEIPVDYGPVVAKLISDGRFHDESEVVTEGLRLVMLRESLHADIQAGIDELDAGERIESSEVYAEARRRIGAIEERNAK